MLTIHQLSTILYNLDGAPLQLQNGGPMTLKYALATVISRAQSADPVHMMEIAHKLLHTTGDEFELEDADVKLLRDIAAKDPGFTNLVRAELLTALASEPLVLSGGKNAEAVPEPAPTEA